MDTVRSGIWAGITATGPMTMLGLQRLLSTSPWFHIWVMEMRQSGYQMLDGRRKAPGTE